MTFIRILMVMVMVMVMVMAGMVGKSVANDRYNDGAQWGSQSQSQGTEAMNGFDPSGTFPGYTTSPAESGYYGGVTSSGVDLASPGTSALTTSEVGKTITDSILNTPPDNIPSMEAPFIAEGMDMQQKAETITNGFEGCVDQVGSFSEITTHQCLRDTKVDQYCTRVATIVVDPVYHYYPTTRTYNFSTQPYYESNGTYFINITPDVSGELTKATYSYQGIGRSAYVDVYGMGTQFRYDLRGSASDAVLDVDVEHLEAGKTYTFTFARKAQGSSTTFLSPPAIRITFTLKAKDTTYQPRTEWNESCPFSKEEGALTSTECIEPGETRTVVVGGIPYSVTEACWAWKDTYLTQSESEGTCGEYIRDKACSVSSSVCVDEVDGFCVSQQVTYSCERTVSGSGKICGGQFFCTDGSCAQASTGTSNMFGKAVSALAAVAAAGSDVAELNGDNVSAFTGAGKFCKKFAVGFNNCCVDSGWGQDVGLSSCSSDEKALGVAKEKRLTVYVGEYCSKKVLGVCLEKKRGYCVFDSKLARIVQEQGRRDQLGVGFGSGKSPDCRGISVEELQGLDFKKMDFSDFYSDLNAGTDIPEDRALIQKAQEIIAQKLSEAGQ